METKTMSPYESQGERNVFCPYYSECLDMVIKKSWMYWSCSECEHFNHVEEPEIPLNSGVLYEMSLGRRAPRRLPME
jgi:hypothetical protein